MAVTSNPEGALLAYIVQLQTLFNTTFLYDHQQLQTLLKELVNSYITNSSTTKLIQGCLCLNARSLKDFEERVIIAMKSVISEPNGISSIINNVLHLTFKNKEFSRRLSDALFEVLVESCTVLT